MKGVIWSWRYRLSMTTVTFSTVAGAPRALASRRNIAEKCQWRRRAEFKSSCKSLWTYPGLGKVRPLIYDEPCRFPVLVTEHKRQSLSLHTHTHTHTPHTHTYTHTHTHTPHTRTHTHTHTHHTRAHTHTPPVNAYPVAGHSGSFQLCGLVCVWREWRPVGRAGAKVRVEISCRSPPAASDVTNSSQLFTAGRVSGCLLF